MQVITSAIDSGDGVFIGGNHLHYNFKPMSNSAFTSENVDQELSLTDLQTANGGFFLLLVSALLPGVANAPAPGDDTYTKPGLLEVAKTGSTLGEPDDKAPGVWNPPGGEQGGCGVNH